MMSVDLHLQHFLVQLCDEYEAQSNRASQFPRLNDFLEKMENEGAVAGLPADWKKVAATELFHLRCQLIQANGQVSQLQGILNELPKELQPDTQSLSHSTYSRSGESFIRRDLGEPASAFQSGMELGAYKMVRQLGSGGMGTVWLAEQTAPIRRSVAIKLVKIGYHDSRMFARFEAERQALALMDHPNIAKVFDGGETNDGSPYLVMELVDGTPLHTFCDNHRLTVPERLRLLVSICRAVQHAHLKGIIHRDLKPSNILITVVDEEPIPKVIDFGLAKALDHGIRLADQSTYTEIGQIVGSYQYMSPEQASLRGTDIDARTDVYSLGVILYELLTGSTPITREELRDHSLVDLLQSIRTGEIARPSMRLSELSPNERSSIAELRRTDPQSLIPSLKSELDWIALKSLEQNRDNRYDTANDLANDIERYLDGDVVSARPPSLKYRLQKTLQKNMALVLATSSVMAVLLIGVVSTLWMLVEARSARADADERAEKLVVAQKETKIMLRSSLISEAGLLSKQRDALGWSWRAGDKLKQASELTPTKEQIVEMRSLFLDCALGLDANHLKSVRSGKFWFVIRFSRDGRFLVAAELKDNTEVSIFIYDTSTWELHKKLLIKDNPLERIGRLWEGKKSQEGVNAMEFSPDGRWLVAGTRQGRIHLWDASNNFEKVDQWDSPNRERVDYLYFSYHSNLLLWQSGESRKLVLNARRWTGDRWQPIEKSFPFPSMNVYTNNPGKVFCSQLNGKHYWLDDTTLEPCEPGILLGGFVPQNSSSLCTMYAKGNLSLLDRVTDGQQSLTIPNMALHSQFPQPQANASLNLFALTSQSSIITLMQSCNGKTESLEWSTVGRIKPAFAMSPTNPNVIASAMDDHIEIYQSQPQPEYVSRLELIGGTEVLDVRVTEKSIWTLSTHSQSAKLHYQVRCYDRQSLKLIQCNKLLLPPKHNSRSTVLSQFTEMGAVELLLVDCGWFAMDEESEIFLKHNPRDERPTIVTDIREGIPVTTVTLDQEYLPEQMKSAVTLHPLQVVGASSIASNFYATHRYPDGEKGEIVRIHDARSLGVLNEWTNNIEDRLTGKAILAQSDVLKDALFISGEDGIVRQFDTNAAMSGRVVASKNMMRSIDCRDDRFLAGSMDGIAMVGSGLKKGEVITWQPAKDEVTSVALLADDLCVIGTKHSGASLWKLNNPPEILVRIPTAGLPVKRIVSDPSGKHFAIVFNNANVVHTWSVRLINEALRRNRLDW